MQRPLECGILGLSLYISSCSEDGLRQMPNQVLYKCALKNLILQDFAETICTKPHSAR